MEVGSIFFENGNPNNPYYISGLDLENSMVLPECQTGEYDKKWVIFKSHDGRCIVISDDSEDARIEITGKKRQINNPPSGDVSSTTTIDGNMTTILLDERSGSEKLLVRTYKGDFLNIDIENRKLQIKFESDITIESSGSIFIKAAADINLKADGNINSDAASINDLCGLSTESPPNGDR